LAEPIINIQGVSKKYKLGKENSGSLREFLAGSVRRKRTKAEEFWALRDISFDVNKGDVIGIIGKNGAGKSTLLKILSRITPPTNGSIRYNGRIASLLEVGTGFHPELSGRENIYINGSILGMKKVEIRQKLDEIVAFSGIEKFIDTPVKRYSSGMYVRLAFAVAAHLEPDILVIDEVLAVGDAEFQKKCLGKMHDLSVSDQRTILFVSHNLLAVKELCNRGVVIEKGELTFDGGAKEAVSLYQSSYSSVSISGSWETDRPGNDSVQVMEVSVTGADEKPIAVDNEFEIKLRFHLSVAQRTVGVSAFVVNEDQVLMFESFASISSGQDSKEGVYEITYRFPSYIMNSGRYFVKFLFAENQQYILYNSDYLLVFEMENVSYNTGSFLGKTPGVIKPKFASNVAYHEA